MIATKFFALTLRAFQPDRAWRAPPPWPRSSKARKKKAAFAASGGRTVSAAAKDFRKSSPGMNQKYKLNLKGQYTPGPDMQRLDVAHHPGSRRRTAGQHRRLSGQRASDFRRPERQTLQRHDLRQDSSRTSPNPKENFTPSPPADTHVAFATAVVGVQYNSQMVKGNDIPRRLSDVLNPKWKGKIASTPVCRRAQGVRHAGLPRPRKDDRLHQAGCPNRSPG